MKINFFVDPHVKPEAVALQHPEFTLPQKDHCFQVRCLHTESRLNSTTSPENVRGSGIDEAIFKRSPNRSNTTWSQWLTSSVCLKVHCLYTAEFSEWCFVSDRGLMNDQNVPHVVEKHHHSHRLIIFVVVKIFIWSHPSLKKSLYWRSGKSAYGSSEIKLLISDSCSLNQRCDHTPRTPECA